MFKHRKKKKNHTCHFPVISVLFSFYSERILKISDIKKRKNKFILNVLTFVHLSRSKLQTLTRSLSHFFCRVIKTRIFKKTLSQYSGKKKKCIFRHNKKISHWILLVSLLNIIICRNLYSYKSTKPIYVIDAELMLTGVFYKLPVFYVYFFFFFNNQKIVRDNIENHHRLLFINSLENGKCNEMRFS